MKISEAFDKYIEECLKMNGGVSNTIIHYKATARELIRAVGDKKLSKLSVSDVAEFRDKMLTSNRYGSRRQSNTVRNYICEIRSVLKYWEARGVKTLNPQWIEIPKKEPKIPPVLSPEEVTAMIDSTITKRGKFIISFLYSSGVRLSELLQLNRDSIHGFEFTVIGKGKKIRPCFIDERTYVYMRNYLRARHDNNPALLVSRWGERMTPTNVQYLVSNAAKNAGIDKHVTPHTLRHSYATNICRNGGDIRYVKDLLGHENISTTAHYIHLTDDDLRLYHEKYHSV